MNSIKRIQLCEYRMDSPDVPEAFEGFRIVFITDIHHGKTFSIRNLRGLVELVNGRRPDLILLGGDYVDHDRDRIAPFFREAADFRAEHGVFGVLGNHDRWADPALSQECMKKAGITLLDNNAVWIEQNGGRIRVGGVGDLWTTTQDLTPMFSGTRPEDMMILLSHHPDFAELLPNDKIDLMLCGHTHGGQVSVFGKWIPPWPGAAKHKYLTGIVQEGGTTVLISNGVGTVGPPIRVFAKPQIWEITLHRVETRPPDSERKAADKTE